MDAWEELLRLLDRRALTLAEAEEALVARGCGRTKARAAIGKARRLGLLDDRRIAQDIAERGGLAPGGILRVRRVPPWRSASLDVGVDQHYSAFGYANALRHVLGNLLGASRHVVVDEDGTAVIETSVAEPTARYLYAPLRRGLLWLSDQVRRLQSGRLEAYVAYMLAALVAVLVAAAVLR